MAKLLDKMEEGILNGNWKIVCDVFNKLTGKNISPPESKEVAQKPLSIDSASKKEILDYLKQNNLYEPRLSKLKLDDLRDYFRLLDDSNQDGDDDLVVNQSPPDRSLNLSPNPSYTYIPPSAINSILNEDKKPLKIRLNDFESYGDEKPPTQKAKRQSTLINARCIKCGSINKTPISRVLVGIGTPNEKTCICPKCT